MDNNLITTIPIHATVDYMAVYPCSEGHNHQEHNHNGIAVVQKLIVIQSPSSSECYIANITPFEDCTVNTSVINERFVIGDELAGFNGFVAYHNLDGAVASIEKYNNGLIDSRADEANPELSSKTKAVMLYPNSKAPIFCTICRQPYCPYPGNDSKHCYACKNHYFRCSCNPWELRCGYCGLKKSACNCVDEELPKCNICNWSLATCQGHSTDDTANPEFRSTHKDIINVIFQNKLSSLALQQLQYGSKYIDDGYQSHETEYIHGITTYPGLMSDFTKMKNHFTMNIKYALNGEYSKLGEALHPILDTYYPLETRLNMLGYFSYTGKQNIISNQSTSIPYIYNNTPCINAINQIYNNLINLPESPTDTQIEEVFDTWVSSGENSSLQ